MSLELFFVCFYFNEPFLFTEQSGQMMKHMAHLPSADLPFPGSALASFT